MSMYPERPIYSPWSDIGSALTQGAGIVNQFDQSRNALQALVDKRAEAAMERQRQQREDMMRETVFAQQQEAIKTEAAQKQDYSGRLGQFQAFQQGEQKQLPQAAPQSYLSPGLGPNNERSFQAPAQFEAIRPTRDQMQSKALELGVYGDPGIKAYMSDTKPETGMTLQDRIVFEGVKAGLKPAPAPSATKWQQGEINGRKVQINPETGEQRDLGPITPKPSGKDVVVAKTKLQSLSIAKQQLMNMQTAFAGVKGSLSAGPGQGWMPSPSGKSFDAAVDAFRNTLTSLTRVPGVGAQSDFEAKLSQAPLPKRGEYESVSLQKMAQLEQLVNTLDSGYSGMVQDGGSGGTEEPSQDAPPSPGRGAMKSVDAGTASSYLQKAGGDRKRAKLMLKKDGYNIDG